jgi:hypothetical protein
MLLRSFLLIAGDTHAADVSAGGISPSTSIHKKQGENMIPNKSRTHRHRAAQLAIADDFLDHSDRIKVDLPKAARFSFANALRRYSIEHAPITISYIIPLDGSRSRYACRVSTRTEEYCARATVIVEVQDNMYDTCCELHRVRMTGSGTDAILVRVSPTQIEAHQLQ